MKKTLIAMAAVAVAGAASAQVTISGKLRFAYETQTSTANAKTSGLGLTDGNITFAASEDLGGGLAISTSMDMRLRGRGAASDSYVGNDVRGRDASMTLSGGFGAIMIGSVEAGNGILGLGGAGAPVYGLDNGVQLKGGSNVDLLQWTSSNFNGFAVKVAHIDTNGALGADNGQSTRLIGVTYAAGPLSVAADSTSYGSAVAAAADTRTRVSASYNLGVAKVGFGNESRGNGTAADSSERVIGVSVPMGAMTLGLVRASSSTTGTAGSNTGTDVGVKYDLSKSTYVAVQYQTTRAAGATVSASKYRVQLSKAF